MYTYLLQLGLLRGHYHGRRLVNHLHERQLGPCRQGDDRYDTYLSRLRLRHDRRDHEDFRTYWYEWLSDAWYKDG